MGRSISKNSFEKYTFYMKKVPTHLIFFFGMYDLKLHKKKNSEMENGARPMERRALDQNSKSKYYLSNRICFMPLNSEKSTAPLTNFCEVEN